MPLVPTVFCYGLKSLIAQPIGLSHAHHGTHSPPVVQPVGLGIPRTTEYLAGTVCAAPMARLCQRPPTLRLRLTRSDPYRRLSAIPMKDFAGTAMGCLDAYVPDVMIDYVVLLDAHGSTWIVMIRAIVCFGLVPLLLVVVGARQASRSLIERWGGPRSRCRPRQPVGWRQETLLLLLLTEGRSGHSSGRVGEFGKGAGNHGQSSQGGQRSVCRRKGHS